MDSPRLLSGKLLLAMPGIGDPRFEHAVIAMCVHDENGAVGIGIGHKRAGLKFRALLKQLDLDPGEAPDVAVHHGGPVEPGRGFILHSTDWGGQDTLHIAGPTGEIFAMTGTIDVLRAIGEGQLDEEMTRHGWFAAQGSPEILFDTPADERWAAAFKAEGIDPRLLASE